MLATNRLQATVSDLRDKGTVRHVRLAPPGVPPGERFILARRMTLSGKGDVQRELESLNRKIHRSGSSELQCGPHGPKSTLLDPERSLRSRIHFVSWVETPEVNPNHTLGSGTQ
jgi:hypothetical protein